MVHRGVVPALPAPDDVEDQDDDWDDEDLDADQYPDDKDLDW